MAPGIRLAPVARAWLAARRVGLWLLALFACATYSACSGHQRPSPANSPTVYLKSADSYVAAASPQARHKTTPAPSKPKASSKPPAETPAPPPAATQRIPVRTIPFVDETLSSLRERLLGRINHLSNDEADQVCLDLELIPHEQVFDRRVNPKKLLLQHIGAVTSHAELESIERTVNELRR